MEFGPYVLGAILCLLFYQILVLKVAAYMTQSETVTAKSYERLSKSQYQVIDSLGIVGEDDWIFLGCDSPVTISGLVGSIFICIRNNYPILYSRVMRIVFVLLLPLLVYFEIIIYRNGMGTRGHIFTVADLVERGCPMGFVSLLGHTSDRARVFVPLLGGPLGITAIYYFLGLAFVVFPPSFKKIIENGIPLPSESSPLLFGAEDIVRKHSS